MILIAYGYGSIPIDTFLVGWTSIYQLFWCSLGTRVLTHPHIYNHSDPIFERCPPTPRTSPWRRWRTSSPGSSDGRSGRRTCRSVRGGLGPGTFPWVSARCPWENGGKMWETPPVLDGISMKLWEKKSFLQWETVTTSSKTLIAIYFSTGKDERTWENHLLKYF